MQLTAAAAGTGTVLASQTIDMRATTMPGGSTAMWSTERQFRIAGAPNGIATYTALDDAIAAASQLSAGSMPGLAVVQWRGGYRIHDVHTVSRTYWSNSPHGTIPPVTREVRRSSVPFAASNFRLADQGRTSAPALAQSDALVALVDGPTIIQRDPSGATWAGRPRLVGSTRS